MKKLVLAALTIALTMVMAFSVSAGSKLKVSNIYSNTTKVKVKFPKKAKYKVVIKVKAKGKKKYKKLKVVKTKKVKSKVIKIKKQKKGTKVQFRATNLKTKKTYKKNLTVKGKAKNPNKFNYSNNKKEESGYVETNVKKTYTSLDTPEMQKQIADDIALAKRTGQPIIRNNEYGGNYFINQYGELFIYKDIKLSLVPYNGMIGCFEEYHEINKTLNNGQFIYSLVNFRYPMNIPEGYKVYLNITGYIDDGSWIGSDEYKNYYNNPALYKYPTKDNYDLCLTSKDKYINDVGRFCEAREGCSIEGFSVSPNIIFITSSVYDSNGNLVAYSSYGN